jgi:hypothetical protein
MQWISTEFQIADIGTKQTPGPRHQFLVELIHIRINDDQKITADTLVQEG